MPINPLDGQLPLTAPTISIPTDSFNNGTGPLIKSYILLFRVKVSAENEIESDEPAAKKRKSCNGGL